MLPVTSVALGNKVQQQLLSHLMSAMRSTAFHTTNLPVLGYVATLDPQQAMFTIAGFDFEIIVRKMMEQT